MVLVNSWVDEGEEFWKEMTLEKLHEHLDKGKGADVLAKNKDGYTPLHFLAHHNENSDVIFAMKEAWYNQLYATKHSGKMHEFVQARDQFGDTPIHCAASWNENPKIIVELMRMGADVNARNDTHSTPLHDAARNNHSENVLYLIALGADGRAQDVYGSKPNERMSIFLNDKATKAINDAARIDLDGPMNFKYRYEDYKF